MIESRIGRYILVILLTAAAATTTTTTGLAVPDQAATQPAAPGGGAPAPAPTTTPAPTAATRKPNKPQTRPHSTRVAVDPKLIVVDDGDTFQVKWSATDIEEVRVLGIDTPETRHVEHDLPYSQPFGEEARAFARGTFAMADKIELLRASTIDPYGRSLAYVFVNGKNYSVLVLEARLAEESITPFGDNGFPAEAAIVLEAARRAGPLPFEPPYQFRNRMRRVSEWMKGKGLYPTQ